MRQLIHKTQDAIALALDALSWAPAPAFAAVVLFVAAVVVITAAVAEYELIQLAKEVLR